MKINRFTTILTVLTLMLSLSVPVFATDYYKEWGPSWEWSDEQWNIANSWTEDQWDAYYKAEDLALIQQFRESMGFTNLDGINVFFDGTCLDFKDVKPVIKNGSTMVPFRTIFEAFGAKVDYSHHTGRQVITASLNDVTLTLIVGQPYMTVEKDNVKKDVSLTSSPFITQGRTLIPVRAISEGVGYDVLWNEWHQVVEIIDKDALIDNIDQRFSIYNRLITDNLEDFDKTFKSKGNISFDATLYGDGENITGGIKSSYTALQKGLAADLKGNIQLNLDSFAESLTYILGEETMKTLTANKNTPLELIIDGETFDAYLKSPLAGLGISVPMPGMINPVLGAIPYGGNPVSLGERDWLKFSMNNLLSMSSPNGDSDFIALFKDPSKMTFGNITYSSLVPSGGNVTLINIYNQMKTSVNYSEIMFGDKYFKKSGSTYTLSMNRMDLLKEIAPLIMAEAGDLDIGDAMDVLNMIPEANYKVVLKESKGRLSDFSIFGDMKIAGAIPLSISFNMKGDRNSSNFDFSMAGRYFGKMKISGDAVTIETNETLRVSPPEGDNIYKFSDLYMNPSVDNTVKNEKDAIPSELKGLLESMDPLIKAFIK